MQSCDQAVSEEFELAGNDVARQQREAVKGKTVTLRGSKGGFEGEDNDDYGKVVARSVLGALKLVAEIEIS